MNPLDNIQKSMISVFADGAKLLGLPKSVGEVYGLLYSSKNSLALDDLVVLLGMSKGSASQALKMLRVLGAVIETEGPENAGRKTFYKADLELKSLAGGFIKYQVRPHLERAKVSVKEIAELDGADGVFYQDRIQKLESWRKKAGFVLPIIQRFLGSK